MGPAPAVPGRVSAFDDFSLVYTSLKKRTLEHRLRYALGLVIPAHVVEATAADRYWDRSVYQTLQTALAKVRDAPGPAS